MNIKARHIAIIVILLMMTGCKKNNDQETNTFTASIELDDDGNRTSLNGVKVYWSTNDRITIYNHNSSHDYKLDGNGPTQVGTFTTTGGVQPTETNYWGFYPAGGCSNRNGDVFTFDMSSATQVYNATGFDEGVNPMAGKNINSSIPNRIYFKNVFSILKINATGNNRPITSIVLTATSAQLTGTFTYNYLDGTTLLSSGTGNTITLTGISETLNNNAKSFYFVVPPHALEGGFSLDFKNGNTVVKSFSVSQSDIGNYATNHLLNPNTIFEAAVNVNVPVPQVTNLIPEMSDSWAVNYYTDHKTVNAAANTYDANNNGAILNFWTGTASGWSEAQVFAPGTYHLINGHKYYLRWCTKCSNVTGGNTNDWRDSNHEVWFLGSSNVNWIVSSGQPDNYTPTQSQIHVNKAGYQYTAAGKTLPTITKGSWQMNSAYRTFTGATGDYQFRIDINNRQYKFGAEIACVMLIDLTADYEGSIPDFNACENRSYFVGTEDRDGINW